jgi:hypothetical protein
MAMAPGLKDNTYFHDLHRQNLNLNEGIREGFRQICRNFYGIESNAASPQRRPLAGAAISPRRNGAICRSGIGAKRSL